MEAEQQVLEVIKNRKSIRRYRPDPVPRHKIELLIEAARWAPSGDNNQPWRFIVVRDPEIKKKMGEISREGSGRRFAAEFFTGRMQDRFEKLKDPAKRERVFRKLTSGEVSAFLSNAPVIIVVCAKLDVWDVPYDTAMCVQNMQLMAHALGLSTCCIVAPVSDMRDDVKTMELLKIPHGYKIALPLAIGFPDESPNPRPRIPLEELRYYEAFGQRRRE